MLWYFKTDLARVPARVPAVQQKYFPTAKLAN